MYNSVCNCMSVYMHIQCINVYLKPTYRFIVMTQNLMANELFLLLMFSKIKFHCIYIINNLKTI